MKDLAQKIVGSVLVGILLYSPFAKAEEPVVTKTERSEDFSQDIRKKRALIGTLMGSLEKKLKKSPHYKELFTPMSLPINNRFFIGRKYLGDRNFSVAFLYNSEKNNEFIFYMSARGDNGSFLKRVIDRVKKTGDGLRGGLDFPGDRIDFIAKGNLYGIGPKGGDEKVSLMESFYLEELEGFCDRFSKRGFPDKLVKKKSSLADYSPLAQKPKRYNPLRPYNP